MPGQDDYGAYLIQKMGEDIANSIRQTYAMRAEEKKYQQTSLQKMRDFMSLPPSKRQQLLQDPNFRQQLMDAIDPHLYTKHKEKKEGPQPSFESLLQMGKPTPEEELQSDILGEQLREARLKTETQTQTLAKTTSEVSMAQLKESIAKGETKPTPMNLLMTGDIKDPLAAALFSNVDLETLTNIAKFEKKTGPLQEQADMSTWFKWGMEQGFQPGLAMKYAMHIAKGEWGDVPLIDPTTKKPVRGKAEQELAVSAMNAQTNARSVQNTIENSIATAAVQLAEKSGLSLDQAQANVRALRRGQPAPFPTPHFSWMAGFEEVLKQQEIKQNTETILNDKVGVSVIRESMNTLLQQHKEGVVDEKQLEAQLNTLNRELSERLAARYGIKWDEPELGFIGTVGAAMEATWNTMKTSGAWSDDASKDISSFMHNVGTASFQGLIMGMGRMAGETGPAPASFGAQTLKPDQEKVLMQLHENAQAQLRDPNTTPEQKKQIAKYVLEVLEPVRRDPSRFNSIFSPWSPE